jgi:HTH-type transcriptional regulator / antitoxin MqsA
MTEKGGSMPKKGVHCPRCDEGQLTAVRGPHALRFREKSYAVEDAEFLLCDTCGRKQFTSDQLRSNQRKAAALARKEMGLLTPDEIIELRQMLGKITQTQLEEMLGVGPKTVTRWEKGTVFQSRAQDLHMRIIGGLAKHVNLFGDLDNRSLVEMFKDIPKLMDDLLTRGSLQPRPCEPSVAGPWENPVIEPRPRRKIVARKHVQPSARRRDDDQRPLAA